MLVIKLSGQLVLKQCQEQLALHIRADVQGNASFLTTLQTPMALREGLYIVTNFYLNCLNSLPKNYLNNSDSKIIINTSKKKEGSELKTFSERLTSAELTKILKN